MRGRERIRLYTPVNHRAQAASTTTGLRAVDREDEEEDIPGAHTVVERRIIRATLLPPSVADEEVLLMLKLLLLRDMEDTRDQPAG